MKAILAASSVLALIAIGNFFARTDTVRAQDKQAKLAKQEEDEVRRLVLLTEELLEKAKKLQAVCDQKTQEIAELKAQVASVSGERNSLRGRLGTAQASANSAQASASSAQASANHWEGEAKRLATECEKYRNCKITLQFYRHAGYRVDGRGVLTYTFYPRPDLGNYTIHQDPDLGGGWGNDIRGLQFIQQLK